ncbi:MAG: (2Fe-2S)-binding protein [Candidatus Omnitrophica bacterium]|nr:(2Fe-2S)-binding protein [Candidatus Omnitrophota bacterium]
MNGTNRYVTLKIDGAIVHAMAGTSVLDTALSYGICIPHLCHMKDLMPAGLCRLCIVEHVKNGKSKVTASCTLEVEEGMVILAHTEKILKARKNIAEMLVAEAPNSRAIQDIAVRCGVKNVRYPFRNKACVLCGRCVRACGEIWRSKSLGFVGRGSERRVALPLNERPEYCKKCNACIDLCPMTITPCPGPMKKGEEYLCGLCESQLSMAKDIEDTCVSCRLGDGFDCVRKRS